MRTAVAALALIASTPLVAQEAEPDPLTAAIAENTLPMARAADGSLSGPGFDRLIEEADAAQFFLEGETHATADIAQVIIALHAAIASRGYDTMAIEVGPHSTPVVEAKLRTSDSALIGFMNEPGNVFAFPFLFFAEETAIVSQAIRLSPKTADVLWGLDQEFLGAGPVLGPKLARLAETDAQRAAAQAFIDGSAANPMHTGAAPDAQIQALVTAFADGSGEARELVDDIALTHRIYGPFTRGAGPIYPANLARENYMKRNFLKHFTKAETAEGSPPKVFFKFGGYHTERGLSGTNVPSLGNFIMEWGRARDFGTVHVMMDCNGGEAFAIMRGGPAPCEPYSLKEGSPLLDAVQGKDLALIDLAALRPLLSRAKDVDHSTRDMILSHDYYLAVGNVKPATPVGDLTLPGQ